MDPQGISKLLEFGLEGAVIAALLFIIWRIIFWAMKWFEKQTEKYQDWVKVTVEQHNKERTIWYGLLEKLNQGQDKLFDSIARHDEKAVERGRYVKEEHNKFLENQQAIIRAADKTCECLDGIKEGLGRINGYTK